MSGSDSKLANFLSALEFDSTMDDGYTLAAEWIKDHSVMKIRRGNQWIDASGEKLMHKLNLPKKLTIDLTVARASAIDDLKRAGIEAIDAYAKFNFADLAVTFGKLRDEVLANSKLLAELSAMESGRIVAECEKDVEYLAEACGFCADHAGFRVGNSASVGLTVILSARATSLNIIADNALPALAVGCPVLLLADSSSEGTLACAAFAEMASKAGFLADVVNFCVVAPDVMTPLFANPAPGKVCYAGPVGTGREVRQLGAKSASRVAVDSGGVVAIIQSHGYIHSAVDAFVSAVLRSVNRGDWWHVVALVVESEFERFWQLTTEKIKKLRPGLDYASDESIPVTSKTHVDERAARGNEVITRGPVAVACDRASVLLCPVVTGGLGIVVPFKSSKDCLALSREIAAPLAAAVFGDREIAQFLNFGSVWIDCFGLGDPSLTSSRFGSCGNGVTGGALGLLEFLTTANEGEARKYWVRLENVADELKGSENIANIGAAITNANKTVCKWASLTDSARRDIVRKIVAELLKRQGDLEPFFPDSVKSMLAIAARNGATAGSLTTQPNANQSMLLNTRVRSGRSIGLVSCHKDWLALYVKIVLPLIRAGNTVVFAAPEDACSVISSTLANVKNLPAGVLELVPGGGCLGAIAGRIAAKENGLDAVLCLGASPASNVADYAAAEGSKEVKVFMPNSIPDWEFFSSIAYRHLAVYERVVGTFEPVGFC